LISLSHHLTHRQQQKELCRLCQISGHRPRQTKLGQPPTIVALIWQGQNSMLLGMVQTGSK
tara:strand:+ start:88 stop:270 length:183 start_codon:yes stop_codon:yes gene_type:complete